MMVLELLLLLLKLLLLLVMFFNVAAMPLVATAITSGLALVEAANSDARRGVLGGLKNFLLLKL